ncbi:MAG: DNA polymerase III subunit delta [Synechococcales bacterium]|nr:DNA polymerase III subunit delta [Synechococcales bacterium]
MPVYVYWGEDDYTLNRAIAELRDRTLDPDWVSFNYTKVAPEQPNATVEALNQAMTPPFGTGKRLVWLADAILLQRCSEADLAELDRTLPHIPETSILLLTSLQKPDGRLKSTKLLQKHAEIREFTTIPPWKTDLLARQVKQAAQEVGVSLSPGGVEMLVEAVGADTRQLYSELEKLRLYGGEGQPISEEAIATLVNTYTQNSLKLAAAIRQGHTSQALSLVTDLFDRNEPALRIVSTLVGQFRLWLWIKLLVEAGERDDRAIARAAEIGNPKRVYFLKQEVKGLSLRSLQSSMALLLDLEAALKQGADQKMQMQTSVIQLCQLFILGPVAHR